MMRNWSVLCRGAVGVGLLLLTAAAGAQSAVSQPAVADLGSLALVSSSGPLAALGPALVSGEVLREIDDPHLGLRWLLRRDPSCPGGPGRLVLADPPSAAAIALPLRSPVPAPSASLPPVIRAGDRLIVEEDTPVAEARLEAVALGPAWPGSPLEVRLKIGGRRFRAVALGPGRAALAPEVRP